MMLMNSCFYPTEFLVVHRCDIEFHELAMILKEKAEAEAGSTGRGPWGLDLDKL